MTPPNLYDSDDSWAKYLLTATEEELDELCRNIHRVSVLVTKLSRNRLNELG